VKRKQEVALQLLRGESPNTLSRDTRQSAAVLFQRRDELLAGGVAALKTRTDDQKVVILEHEFIPTKGWSGN